MNLKDIYPFLRIKVSKIFKTKFGSKVYEFYAIIILLSLN